MTTQTTSRAWRLAAGIVSTRPWLDISWIDSEGGGHLTVHDGALGAALHFEDDGPIWEPRSEPVRELEWDDVTEPGSARVLGATDWVECWGSPARQVQLTEKVGIYSLIAQLLDESQDGSDDLWTARPAKLLHDTDEDAARPESAFSLVDSFPSLARRVTWYVNQISSASWGEGKVWHEPLWLLSRDGSPRIVADEAGTVHLTFGSLLEAVELLATAADLGGIEDPHSFEILDALSRLNGSVAQLAHLARRGPADVLAAVKPDYSSEADSDSPPQ